MRKSELKYDPVTRTFGYVKASSVSDDEVLPPAVAVSTKSSSKSKSGQKRTHQQASNNRMLVTLVAVTVLLLIALSFALLVVFNRPSQDFRPYRNVSDVLDVLRR